MFWLALRRFVIGPAIKIVLLALGLASGQVGWSDGADHAANPANAQLWLARARDVRLHEVKRAMASDCAAFPDADAYEFADLVFTGTLEEIVTPAGDIVVSTDPEQFVFEVDQVFKGEAQARQSVVTAREGASCGLEISGPGPFVVFARLDDDGVTSGAVDGEVYSGLCSGTRPLADGDLPTGFGEPSPPVAMAASGSASSPPASSANVRWERGVVDATCRWGAS